MNNKNTNRRSLLRTAALTTLLVGAIGSLYFMFKAGSNQKSIILLILFSGWVLSPFVGLTIANRFSKRFTGKTYFWLYWTMIALSVASLIAYSGALIPPGTKPAFIFLVVPFVSWLFILIIFLITKRHSIKDRNQNK